MKLKGLLIFGISLSSMPLCFGQTAFEGVITLKTTNEFLKETATIQWFHDSGKNHMEFDSKAGEHHMKYSMTMESNEETVLMESGGKSQEVSGITAEEVFTSANFVRKAKTTEAGYDCEMLMFKSNGNDLTYWVTSDIKLAYSDLPKLFRNNMPSFAGISNGFPLKMELRDSSGNLLRSQEVVSVESKKIDDSFFKR